MTYREFKILLVSEQLAVVSERDLLRVQISSFVLTTKSHVLMRLIEGSVLFICPNSQKLCLDRTYNKFSFLLCVQIDGFSVRTEFTESFPSALCPDMIITCPDTFA
jgi:hypothetical protein